MEGIFDGRAVDGCFLCDLLYPDEHRHDCPRCGRRMHYQPAVMMGDAALRDAVRAHVLAFVRAGPGERGPRLVDLLEHLHRFAPASVHMLHELGHGDAPGLDALRLDYDRLFARAVVT